MNAAEITDKLGLHSLRQRAWVSIGRWFRDALANQATSISNRLAPLPETVCTRASNGSATPCVRQATTRIVYEVDFSSLPSPVMA
jgi:hypothetical protein